MSNPYIRMHAFRAASSQSVVNRIARLLCSIHNLKLVRLLWLVNEASYHVWMTVTKEKGFEWWRKTKCGDCRGVISSRSQLTHNFWCNLRYTSPSRDARECASTQPGVPKTDNPQRNWVVIIGLRQQKANRVLRPSVASRRCRRFQSGPSVGSLYVFLCM